MSKRVSSSRIDLIDTFVVSSVVTIIITRLYLLLTGFPTVGGSNFHIAHVLWGGALLTIALLMGMLATKMDKLPVAVVGGTGFGLFIDEVGKFVTHDNNYFYKDAFYLMYLSLLGVWLIARLIIIRQEKRKFFLPAEWPKKAWMRVLIFAWSLVQIIDSIIAIATLQIASDTYKTLTPAVAVFFSTVYLIALLMGVAFYITRKMPAAARVLRAANVLCLIFVSPVLYLYSPVFATVGAIGACIAAIALSEVSIVALLRKLMFWRY